MRVELPDGIDYSQYAFSSGLATKEWGPRAWHFLFASIMGAYPYKLEKKNKEHKNIKRAFIMLFTNLKTTMPCIFCRRSFEQFLKELPIEPFTIGRIEMMYWLYLMRDKVNNKLIAQEKSCYNNEKRRLKKMVHKGTLSEEEYYDKIAAFKQKTLITSPTPDFKEVLDKYEAIRAKCSKRAQTCVKKTTK
jgi:hypothetical protein